MIPMEKLKNESNSNSSGASEDEEGCILRSPINSNGHIRRKRIKLQVSEDCKPVDPPIVPRRLRSAINKRPRHSVSPPLSDSKKKHLSGYIAERSGQKMLDHVTKDEEDVANALTMLASLPPLLTPTNQEENKRPLEKKDASKVSKKETSACNGVGTSPSKENIWKDEPSTMGKSKACWLEPASRELELQTVKWKLDSGTAHYINQQKAILGVRSGLPSSTNGISRMSSKSITTSEKHSTTRNNLSTKRVQCKNCVTHVYISNFIKSYPTIERKEKPLLPSQGFTCLTGNNKNPVLNGFHLEKSSSGGETQPKSFLYGAYGPQEPVHEFLPTSAAADDAKHSRNGSLSSIQHVPYNMAFPFMQGPYPSQYPASASHQAPNLVGTSAMYNQQIMNASAATTKHQHHQQQQMWQAQMMQYRPPLGFSPMWAQQNGHHAASSTPNAYPQHNFLPQFALAPQTLQPRSKQQQHPQLQMLFTSTETLR